MNKTRIEYCDFTWNPVVGCKNGCKYCYAKKIHDRFFKDDFSHVKFYPKRLLEPAKLKKPSVIFVGSMSDIFFWEPAWTAAILDVADRCRQHTFLFLTKNAQAYHGLFMPKNCWAGLTLEKLVTYDEGARLMDLKEAGASKRFISLEPLLGCFEEPLPSYVDRVIVGSMTGPGATKPELEWIRSVEENVPEGKLFWKNNIQEYRGNPWPRKK